jgi:hypothetical protein
LSTLFFPIEKGIMINQGRGSSKANIGYYSWLQVFVAVKDGGRRVE